MKYSIIRIFLLSCGIVACGLLPEVNAGGSDVRGSQRVLGGSGNNSRRRQHQLMVQEERRQRRRRRRAMDNHRHRQRYNNNYPDSRYYYTQQEQSKQQQKNQHYQRTKRTEATLADVWLCYAFALGWSMWFLSSFLNTDLMRFAESESVLVHGNVREVSIEDDSLGTGIPTYHALIDYIITVRRRSTEAARIQVRKSFQTQHLLQQGFANVELLVLPEEPTSSVLKEDWQREVAAQEQAEEDIISIGGFGDIGTVGGAGDCVGGGRTASGVGSYGENDGTGRGLSTVSTLSRVDVWAKRTSLILSGVLVTASLIGAVQAVHRIPNERVALLGWVSVVVGSVLLWPLAFSSLRIISACQRLGRLPTEKSGIILKCDTNAQVGTTINEEEIYTQHQDKFNRGNISTRHLDKVDHAGVFEKLKSPQQQKQQQRDQPEGGDSSGSSVPTGSTSKHEHNNLDISADESACYFVKLPGQKDASGVARLDDSSSLSTISANSHLSKTNRTRNSVSST